MSGLAAIKASTLLAGHIWLLAVGGLVLSAAIGAFRRFGRTRTRGGVGARGGLLGTSLYNSEWRFDSDARRANHSQDRIVIIRIFQLLCDQHINIVILGR